MMPFWGFLHVQIVLLKSTDGADIDWSKEAKGNMYDMVVEGFQLLSKWTGRVWEQCAWKFSRPCKDAIPAELRESSTSFFDYEKVCCVSLLYELLIMQSLVLLR